MQLTEEQARQEIDRQLEAAGWIIQNVRNINLAAGPGVAIRELQTKGPADYALFVNKSPIGIIEAKKAGTTLSGVAEQSGKYLGGLRRIYPRLPEKPPFAYESTGIETFFRDERDPEPRSRRVFTFHRPETLAGWLSQPNTLRVRLRSFPP